MPDMSLYEEISKEEFVKCCNGIEQLIIFEIYVFSTSCWGFRIFRSEQLNFYFIDRKEQLKKKLHARGNKTI
jgi:hypothetical protein